MSFRTRFLNLLQWQHLPRCIPTQSAEFSISLPRFRAPGSGPKLKPRSKTGSSIRITQSRKQPDPQHASDWSQSFLKATARWKSGWQARYAENRLHRLAVHGVVLFISGTTIVYLFVLERVPITDRKRFSWLSRSALTKLEESERETMKRLQKDEENLFIKSDYPGLRKIDAVLNRLVKASALDDVAWEVRVIDKPNEDSACVLRSGLVLITSGFFHHVISNDDELAAVLSHEVAHVIARHIAEAKFISLADKYFTKPFSSLALFAYIFPEAIVFLVPIAVSSFISLALSRFREREADYIGLLLMADAGFDLSGAVSFWTKLDKWEEEQQRGAKKRIRREPQFRSTHPHTASRVTQIEKWIPEIHDILRGLSSGADQGATQSRNIVAKRRRWQDFAGKRDGSRRLIREKN